MDGQYFTKTCIKTVHYFIEKTAADKKRESRLGPGEVLAWYGKDHDKRCEKKMVTATRFELVPFRTGALNRRLRPLGHAAWR